ncbi:Uncharacterised protein [Klebsiella pneumoniae]|uniref:Uncharacterized protein n=1 Tax=Klebsiella pneumoniae TaxID=573 RepID=A0A377W2B2_KLEPN|nr:Uncharacterised protein [Klebsiella variicola]SSK77876.1 Uncharacterised protein [Klebsiella pneumoniae]SAU14687.1 Uncharacterised protein [Klebsiella variicola]SBH63485.1 Uncharacterised protein [Klebsiella variicola]SLO85112.1 Uncharacterised protein [Klebsiella variicola]
MPEMTVSMSQNLLYVVYYLFTYVYLFQMSTIV